MLRLTKGGVCGDDECRQCIPDHRPSSCNCDTDRAFPSVEPVVLSLCLARRLIRAAMRESHQPIPGVHLGVSIRPALRRKSSAARRYSLRSDTCRDEFDGISDVGWRVQIAYAGCQTLRKDLLVIQRLQLLDELRRTFTQMCQSSAESFRDPNFRAPITHQFRLSNLASESTIYRLSEPSSEPALTSPYARHMLTGLWSVNMQ